MSIEGLVRLRSAAALAREQGCHELADEIERLVAAAEVTTGARPCARCGGSPCGDGEALTGAVLKISFNEGSTCRVWRGVVCAGCYDELRAWAPGLELV